MLQALLSQTETSDQIGVTFGAFALDVLKQALALTNHHQQTTTGVVVFLVLFEVFCQLVDACGQ